jgi:hypothetical protein
MDDLFFCLVSWIDAGWEVRSNFMFGRLDETIEQGCDDQGEITPAGFS